MKLSTSYPGIMVVSSKCTYKVESEISSNIGEVLGAPTVVCWHVSSWTLWFWCYLLKKSYFTWLTLSLMC